MALTAEDKKYIDGYFFRLFNEISNIKDRIEALRVQANNMEIKADKMQMTVKAIVDKVC